MRGVGFVAEGKGELSLSPYLLPPGCLYILHRETLYYFRT